MPKTLEVTSSVREGKRKDALTTSLKGAKRPDQIPFETRWKYDDILFRHNFESGRAHVDQDEAFCNFMDWLSVEHKLTFENKITGESFSCIGSKRGNKQFAINKWKKVKIINEAMKDRQFDFEIPSHRNIYRNCQLLLITLTFRQDISIEQAWFLTSAKGKAQNKFKANLAKILGSKATVCAKEAQSNGYPAPHILVLLDNLVRVKHHKGKKGKS